MTDIATEDMSWTDICKTDGRYLEYLETLRTSFGTDKIGSLTKRFSVDYRGRKIRDITTKQVLGNPKEELADILLEGQQLRSNLVDSKSAYYVRMSSLESYKKDLSNYLQAAYADQFAKLKNEAMRKSAIESLFEEANNRIQRYARYIYFCDERLQDIDQEKWTIKSLVDVLKINEAQGGEI